MERGQLWARPPGNVAFCWIRPRDRTLISDKSGLSNAPLRTEPRADATLLPRELQREKVWSRIHLVPLLLAEGDRDAYRRQQAALAREREIMKDVPGWEVSDVSNGGMSQSARSLITYCFPAGVPCCDVLRRVHDRLAKASTTTPAIGLRRLSWLYDGSSHSLYQPVEEWQSELIVAAPAGVLVAGDVDGCQKRAYVFRREGSEGA